MGRIRPAFRPFDRLRASNLMATPEEHIEVSRRFLAHADEFLDVNDLPQASEKAWGAVAQYLKAVANRRGWRNGTHRDFFTIKSRLAQETDDPRRISELFAILREQHINFYEISYPQDDVRVAINSAGEFVEMLEQAGVMHEPPADSLNGTAQDGIDGNI